MRLKDVKQGCRFVEEDMGAAVLMEALEDAYEITEPRREGFTCRARVIEGTAPLAVDGVVTYFECLNPGAYTLRLTEWSGHP